MSTLKNYIQIMPQELATTSSTQGTDLGALATTGDGRVFRYVQAGATALVPGKLYQSSAEDTTNFQNLAVATASSGAVTVTTSTTVTIATANFLAGGLMVVTTGTGAGYTYKIKSHPAVTASTLTLTLEDPLQTALAAASSKIDVHPNVYSNIILNPASATSTAVGVAVYPVTAGQYGWVQTHGPVGVLADGALTVGDQIVASNGTAGAVELAVNGSTEAQAAIGYAVTGVATTEYGQVFLTID